MSIVVVDDSITVPEASSDRGEVGGLSVSIFKPETSLFPPVQSEDEIVQFRHMRIQTFQSSLQAVSTNWSAFTVFSRDEDGQWIAKPSRPVLEEERHILDRIAARTGHTAAVVRTSPKKPQLVRQLLTVDILQTASFFDLVAEVVHILSSSKNSSQRSVLLCDYTVNPLIGINPLDFDLPSEYEHRLLLTTFWDNFVSRIEGLREGQIVRLLNLRSKMLPATSDFDPQRSGLIAVMHGDRFNQEKIFVLPTTDPQAQAIIKRKEALLGLKFNASGSPPLSDAISEESESPCANANVLSQTDSDPVVLISPRSPTVQLQVASESFASASVASLRHSIVPLTSMHSFIVSHNHLMIAILHADIPVSPIRSVFEASGPLAKFVIKGRVIGYTPQDISGFTRRVCSNCRATPGPDRVGCNSCDCKECPFAFIFSLKITDGIDTLDAIVAYQDAIRFLNGMKPSNLLSDAASKAYLQDCIQSLTTSPIPTSFCIKSYLSPNQKSRRYRIFDTLLSIPS